MPLSTCAHRERKFRPRSVALSRLTTKMFSFDVLFVAVKFDRQSVDMAYGHVIGYRRPTFWQEWWQYVDIETMEQAKAIGVYGFVASILPVWMLLTPRDYLSTFMKIGVIVLLALAWGIFALLTYDFSDAAARAR